MRAKDLTQEYLKPNLDFIAKYADLVAGDKYRETLKKMVSNFDTAWKGAKDSDELKAYLNMIYITNARGLAGELLSNGQLTAEILAEVNALPSKEEGQAMVQVFSDAIDAKRNDIMQQQMAFADHNKEIEVLKGIAFGDSPTKAKKAVEERNQQLAQAAGLPQ